MQERDSLEEKENIECGFERGRPNGDIAGSEYVGNADHVHARDLAAFADGQGEKVHFVTNLRQRGYVKPNPYRRPTPLEKGLRADEQNAFHDERLYAALYRKAKRSLQSSYGCSQARKNSPIGAGS
jgi:hypothetical protein